MSLQYYMQYILYAVRAVHSQGCIKGSSKIFAHYRQIQHLKKYLASIYNAYYPVLNAICTELANICCCSCSSVVNNVHVHG